MPPFAGLLAARSRSQMTSVALAAEIAAGRIVGLLGSRLFGSLDSTPNDDFEKYCTDGP